MVCYDRTGTENDMLYFCFNFLPLRRRKVPVVKASGISNWLGHPIYRAEISSNRALDGLVCAINGLFNAWRMSLQTYHDRPQTGPPAKVCGHSI